ncbi:PAS domain S-box protein [Methanonatronarchaeum sp. AMET6-2]|uniref:response regulator n=1 Tax=Methanonatronarchaeum sp. AMET6-2 TaxID=2933293 RepID=UPI001FF3595A|nr:PAS domain S-box protein [Methanonatronarchaeum sp. AMET6-2]UOY09937.1 PAS domain S-box protein [Methanonatronarchaeum sp. AMET6-2]
MGPGSTDGFKVLLVDDDVSFLELTEVYIQGEELDITTVSDPNEAVENYMEYDCVVSDYQMPGMDGLEFLRKVREEDGSDIPFIMFTGKGREEVAMDALNHGADRYLQKGGDPKTQFMELKHAIKDAVDKKQTKKKLKIEKKKAEKYFETARVLMVAVDEEGCIQDLNYKASEVLDKDREELVGEDWFDNYIARQHTEEAIEVHRDVIQSGEDRSIEIPISTSSGERRVISWRISPLKDGDNGINGTLGSGLDVSERKRREEELKEKTSMLEGMLDGIRDIIGFQLPDHTILRYNQQGYKTLGISEEKAVGEKCYKLIGRESPCEVCPTQKAIKTGEIVHLDKYQPELDMYLCVTANPVIGDDGEVEFIIEHLRDITKRKEYEERIKELSKEYEIIFNNVHTSIFLLNVDDGDITVQRWNPYEEELFGKKTSEVKGKTAIEIFGEEGRKLEEKYRKCLEEKKTISYEESIETEEGVLHAVTKLTPIINEDEVEMIVGTSLDITERKNKEKELEKALTMLRTLMEAQEVGILFENEDRDIIYVNEEFCRLFNIPDKEDLVGLDCRDAADQAKELFKYPDRFRDGIEELVGGEEKKKSDEFELKDGRILSK